ncbi:hypothetical protein [Arthrobacter sp. 179]|uniref:hypothetical protein n=1 Tax=Arthrobacter sp. 179 TaxID=3457734 RepID=UPI004034352D
MSNTDVLRARSVLGNATRKGSADEISGARRDLAAAKLAAYVEATLAAAPPLSPEQAARIASKLQPASGGGAK